MICVSIAEKDSAACLQKALLYELAEIRLDAGHFTSQEVKQIFSSHTNLVATCRPGTYNHQERIDLLLEAIRSGAAYVDIETESEAAELTLVHQEAQLSGTKVIISYHNFQKTPTEEELHRIVDTCANQGADVIKVACMVNTPADNARLLGLYNRKEKMIAIGMGPEGTISRIVAPLLGAAFTFAAPDEGEATAPGQLKIRELKEIITSIQKTKE
jgi:3-dehydroquinate dehydratase-1